MDKLLKLMLDGEALSTEQMGKILGLTKEELDAQLKKLIEDGILLGWRPVINPDVDESVVHAAIELRINPERDGGFDRLAQRISKFDQVDSCYLMSGAFDLLIFVRAKSLRGVASFVYEKLATIAGVTSTATHFFLKTYKQQGFIINRDQAGGDRLIYSP
jgi:DNA-binding Lrp family transcriptional regulator